MNYISDYLDNLLDDKRADMVFPSFQNVQVQDPLSKLIKWLNTDRGVGIKIKSEEDILIEDFLPARHAVRRLEEVRNDQFEVQWTSGL